MDQIKIGEFLKTLRIEKGLTQEELARSLMSKIDQYLVGKQVEICLI